MSRGELQDQLDRLEKELAALCRHVSVSERVDNAEYQRIWSLFRTCQYTMRLILQRTYDGKLIK
jgi:hypothetical protein